MPKPGDLARDRKHPASGDLYTPVTPEFIDLLNRMRAEHGSWRNVCAISNTRMKVMRNLRTGKRKAVSQRLVDRLISTTEVGSLEEFTWFTADDLVALGIWNPVQYVEGDARIKGDDVHFVDRDELKKARKQDQARKKRERRREKKIKERAARKWTFPPR